MHILMCYKSSSFYLPGYLILLGNSSIYCSQQKKELLRGQILTTVQLNIIGCAQYCMCSQALKLLLHQLIYNIAYQLLGMCLLLDERTDSRAEHNLIISTTFACKCACLIILRVTVSIWATILEKLGIICRSTTPRIATIFIGFEYGTKVVTPSLSFQLSWALPIDISQL